MEAYVMAAISNNTPLKGMSLEARTNRLEMRRFKDHYCETIGGRIVGVKQDPLIRRDLHTWVRKNIFYADKRNVEEFKLPTLAAETVAVGMHPQVETAYRSVTTQFASVMGGMVSKFRDRGHSMNPEAPNAKDRGIEKSFGRDFKPIIKLLNDLSNAPDKAFRTMARILETDTIETKGGPIPVPDIMKPLVKAWSLAFTPETLRETASTLPNPKMEIAEDRIRAKIDKTNGTSRTILFSDDKELCVLTAEHMSKTVAGKHAVGLKDSIRIFDGTGELTEIQFEIDPVVLMKTVKDQAERTRILQETGGISRHKLPFGPHPMRKFPELPASHDNVHYKKDQWQQFVMNEIVSPDKSIRTLTLFGPDYSLGHNLQSFDTVIHMDRDTWNAEMMKQRTARSWRQGQDQPVDEITLDSTYSDTMNEFDKTLDEIRGFFQGMDGEIFSRIIQDSMDVDLGEEWEKIKHGMASSRRIDLKTMDLMTSPYVGRSEPPGM